MLAALDEEGRESIEQVKAAMEDFDTVDAAAVTSLKCTAEEHE